MYNTISEFFYTLRCEVFKILIPKTLVYHVTPPVRRISPARARAATDQYCYVTISGSTAIYRYVMQ